MQNHLAKVRIIRTRGVWSVYKRRGEVYRPLDLKRAQAWCRARNQENAFPIGAHDHSFCATPTNSLELMVWEGNRAALARQQGYNLW